MKKTDIIFPVTITALFAGIIVGILIARYASNTIVNLPTSNNQAAVSTESIEADSNNQINKLNINTASVNELAMLPGIGDKLAQEIVSYRETSGLFTSIDELSNVYGIGQKRLDAISEYITVE
ncbi:MAG: helix-hairpin-helix domain-containing protein [Oscillospiraceae bacterium]|nr:helix-hairpin-helix domain-containing protein [Oscillospiraceae bacterium]